MDDEVIMEKELDELRDQHKSLDSAIRELELAPFPDQLQIMRLKREKLKVKDAMCRIEEVMYPDIIA